MVATILHYAIYLWAVPILVLVVAAVVIVLRMKAKARSERPAPGGEVTPDRLQVIKDATEADQIAYSIVERYRKRMWRQFSVDTWFSVAVVSDLCGSVISEIAHVYYPHSSCPELEVTLDDLLDLNERIIARARKLLEKFPLNKLQGISINQFLTYHRLYRAVTGNVVLRSIRNRWARRAATCASIAVRYASPKFWLMKGIARGGKEFAVRYFLTSLVTIAGEEAILLYRRERADLTG